MLDLTHAGPSIFAAFIASLVEFVEAMTIILAVGTVRGWKPALIGAFAGVVLLVLLVLILGPTLQHVPINILQLIIGVLLILFGMRWLRKAILRSAGIIGLHDEEAIYAKETAVLRKGNLTYQRMDIIAVSTTFKAVVLEGLEVVFIVIATGAVNGMLVPASIGAAAAAIFVIALGLLIHKPLSRVPENTLKFMVGVMLSAFGVFWLGEGLHFKWLGQDWALLGLIAAFFVTAAISVHFAKRSATCSGEIPL